MSKDASHPIAENTVWQTRLQRMPGKEAPILRETRRNSLLALRPTSRTLERAAGQVHAVARDERAYAPKEL